MSVAPIPAGPAPGVDSEGSASGPRGVHLACETCAREFTVDVSAYRALCGIIECPRCGSTDLVLLDPGDDSGPGPAPR